VTYYEAKRKARALFGAHGDARELKGNLLPFRIGVWLDEGSTKTFITIGSGLSYEDALKEARERQV